MKKLYIGFLILLFLISGCDKRIKPLKTERVELDIIEANTIMKNAWKPVYEMTNNELETRPLHDIYTKQEFFDSYDFSFMCDRVREDIFETVVDMDEQGVVRDDKGRIVFGEDNIIAYIPTVYSDDIYVDKAYLNTSTYEKEYSYMDKTELIIEERSNGDNIMIEDFHRTSTFFKNENNEWILDRFEGTISVSWSR